MQLNLLLTKNKLIIAAAGSGKTTHLVNQAKRITDQNVLITTYTVDNENEIRKKFNGYIPPNVTILTWFSFLLKHGVRPFQSSFFQELCDKKIRLDFVNHTSAMKSKGGTIQHYFTKDFKIYSDKISKFIVKCDNVTNGDIVNRISKIFPNIYIDEIQDLAGFDLEFLELLFSSRSNILLVGDPRQGTYSTNNSAKNKKYMKSEIINFFMDARRKDKLAIDEVSLLVNHRSNSEICEFSNRLYPNFSPTRTGGNKVTGHDGIFLVKNNDIEEYCKKYECVILRAKEAVYPELNWGKSKGLEFDRILIYPTLNIKKWIKDNKTILAPVTRSKFYVALTRAKYSVAIVFDFNDTEKYVGVKKWKVGE